MRLPSLEVPVTVRTCNASIDGMTERTTNGLSTSTRVSRFPTTCDWSASRYTIMSGSSGTHYCGATNAAELDRVHGRLNVSRNSVIRYASRFPASYGDRVHGTGCGAGASGVL